jgi:hypothetical protein
VGLLRRLSCGWLLATGVLLMPVVVGAAAAAPTYADGPVWAISSTSSPTNFAAGDETGDDTYVLTIVDTGDRSASGSPIEVGDTLPSGLVASGISGEDLGNGKALSCRLTPSLGCDYEGFEMAPGDVLRIDIAVKVSSGIATSVVNSATVMGGGAEAAASIEAKTTVSSTPAAFGISDFATTWSSPQAGASVNLTTSFTFNQLVSGGETLPAAYTKEVALNLPPGFIANPEAAPQCTMSEVEHGTCSAAAAVGVAFMSSSSGVGGAPATYSSLVYNADPSTGELGALALLLPGGLVRLRIGIRAGGDYGLRLTENDLPEVDPLLSMTMTLWGVPAAYNGAGPDHTLAGAAPSFGSSGSSAPTRFLTSAGTCSTLPDSGLSADSWAAPSVFAEALSPTPALTGCNRLAFEPSLAVAADGDVADEPSGYTLDLNIPQHKEAEGLASADLKNAAVTLPEGTGVSLSASDGLLACTEAEMGLGLPAAVTCPEASKIGTVEVQTPLFAYPLQGTIYLAAPNENPFGSPLAMYVVAEEAGAGIQIKLAGQIEANPLTGQLTIVLRELPRLQISGLRLHFFGGGRALLSTPAACGAATSTAELTPWSGDAGVKVSSEFEIDSGVGGTPCSELPSFNPSFEVGITAAGEVDAYGSLALFVSRTDEEQELGTIAIQAPAAVAQMFAGVPSCGEPQASEGMCATASEVGTVAARAGLGPFPDDLRGDVYLTGSYDGYAQGLSIVLPVNPAPFELGNVVVRAGLEIDSVTGRLSIVSDQLPKIADGVPLKLDALLLQFDLGEFKIAPDGCESLAVTGTITSTQGSSIVVSTDPLGVSSSPCPPSPTLPPGAGVVSSSTANVSLVTRNIATSGRGVASVKLACTGTGMCRGRLTLKGKSKAKEGKKATAPMIGTADFSIPAGTSATVELKLDTRGRTLLGADRGRLGATLTILKSSPAPSQTHSEAVRLVREKVRRAGK